MLTLRRGDQRRMVCLEQQQQRSNVLPSIIRIDNE
jgi:hypothetical protein